MTIARLRMDLVDQFRAVAGAKGVLELLSIDPRLQTRIDYAPRLGVKHVPGFGFAIIRRNDFGGKFIVRVDLQREVLLGVQKFDQQREARLADDAGREFPRRAAGPEFPREHSAKVRWRRGFDRRRDR